MNHYFETPPEGSVRPGEYTIDLLGRKVTIATEAGVFSGRRLDPGTSKLIEHLAAHATEFCSSLPGGVVVDVGCGAGPISVALGMLCPERSVIGVDVNARAVELTRRNARAAGLDNVAAVHLGDQGADPTDLVAGAPIAAIVSNPPVRIGKEAMRALLAGWQERLAPGGRMLLVVSRHLGADSLATWLGRDGAPVERIASKAGYRLLQVGTA